MAFIQQSESKNKIAFGITLDPRTKLLFLLIVSVLSVAINDLLFQLFLFDIVLIVTIFSKADLLKVWQYMKPTIWLALPIFIIQVFFSYVKDDPLVILPKTWPIFSGYVLISVGSILFAGSICLRILTLAMSSILFSLITNTDDFLNSLRKIGIPYNVAFAAGLIIYFLPMVINETTAVRNALETRGVSITKGGIIKRIKTFRILISALLLNFLEKSKYQAIAMDSRGFGSSKKKTKFKDIRFKIQDYIVSFILLMIVSGLIYYYWDRIIEQILYYWNNFVTSFVDN